MALDLVDTGIVNFLSIQTCPYGFFSDPVSETYQNARKFGVFQESLDLDEKWMERRGWTSEWKLRKRNGKRGKMNITSLIVLVENMSHRFGFRSEGL